jgi:hypothetical protein
MKDKKPRRLFRKRPSTAEGAEFRRLMEYKRKRYELPTDEDLAKVETKGPPEHTCGRCNKPSYLTRITHVSDDELPPLVDKKAKGTVVFYSLCNDCIRQCRDDPEVYAEVERNMVNSLIDGLKQRGEIA